MSKQVDKHFEKFKGTYVYVICKNDDSNDNVKYVGFKYNEENTVYLNSTTSNFVIYDDIIHF